MCVALRKGVHGVESLFGACPALRRCLNADHVDDISDRSAQLTDQDKIAEFKYRYVP